VATLAGRSGDQALAPRFCPCLAQPLAEHSAERHMPSEFPPDEHRSGFVALCGRPNVGKSTLLNAILGHPLAVATPHPQTTRERLLGVWTGADFQAVLVDTPGIHRARSALNRFMVAEAMRGAKDVDLVLMLADVPRLETTEQAEAWQPGPVAIEALQALADLGHPIVLVLTKIDLLADPRLLLPITATWAKHHTFAAIVPTSARTGSGIDVLQRALVERLPPGPRYYDDPDLLSDRNMRWHAAELIRGEIFARLSDELPYSCAVRIDDYKSLPDVDKIHGSIFVERDSQKSIVIGRGGQMIKSISQAARAKIAELTGKRCDLRLEVRVASSWTDDPHKLKEFGYGE
jgi:GTP-binding protein Era